MDRKAQQTLAYHEILKKLASFCEYEPAKEKARKLKPTTSLKSAKHRQNETAEAIEFLNKHPNVSINHARDIRDYIKAAQRFHVLEPAQFLDIKHTLITARTLRRTVERSKESFPILWEIASRLPPSLGLVDSITQTFSERGDILDSASSELSTIRKSIHIQRERLMGRMQHMIKDPKIAPYLQENIITQRDGRYVLPLRSEFKGKIKAIIHDQSASGATIFIEPISLVELNNKFRELQLSERKEEQRILLELTSRISEHADSLSNLVSALSQFDLALAKARYAQLLHATKPILRPIKPPTNHKHPGVTIRLFQARHPLLDPKTAVPIDVVLDNHIYAMVITGPNTGGKTVTLKTIGLLALMAQAGLHIPAQAGSEISIFKNIFADIGDEQSIEQSLSTFSSHITNIIHILKKADSSSLVLLDELGAGTDPQEGAALARALLNHLLSRNITSFVTTHHPELKAFAHTTEGVVNASVEFDLDTLEPTYHLTIGLPGRSNALAIAERLGLPHSIIAQARAELNPLDLKADSLINEIHRQRNLARKAREEAEQLKKEAERLHQELASRLEAIEDERKQLLEKTQKEAQEALDEIKKELKRIKQALEREHRPLENIKTLTEQINEIEENITSTSTRYQVDVPEDFQIEDLSIGSKVRLKSLRTEGIVTALSDDEAEVQIGVLRVRTRITDLASPHTATEQNDNHELAANTTIVVPKKASPGIELDLRGKRADEAIEALSLYLDKAYMAGLPWVRIIHGKGTGKLRKVTREALQNHPHVQSFEYGKPGEGGDGVTIAFLQSSL